MKFGLGLFVSCLAAAALCNIAAPTSAAYPDKPIHLIVPYPPGGFTDLFARMVAKKLTEAWGQPVIVEDRPGASTIIGMNAVAKSASDGYTLGIAPFSTAVNPMLFHKLPYDTQKDFTPIILGTKAYNILATNPSTSIHSIKDLVSQAKARPGKIDYASTGNGTSTHLSAEILERMAHIQMTHVPYKGSVPGETALLSGQVQLMFDTFSTLLPQVKAGKLRAVAVTGPRRSPLLPNVPTVAESGLPGYEVFAWFGIVGPKNLPRPVVDKLNRQINLILKTPDVQKMFTTEGVDAAGGTPEQFAGFIHSEMNKWAPVIKAAHIRLD